MPGEQHGECVILRDVSVEAGGRYDDEAYVRGHVDDATFRAAIAATYDDDEDVPEYGPIRHVWARWEFSGQSDYGNPCRTLAEHRTPGRGKFPVTAATHAGLIRRREATQRQRDSDVAELLNLYPGVEVVHANGYGRDYRLRTPSGAEVNLRWHPAECKWTGWARGVDVPAWENVPRQRPGWHMTPTQALLVVHARLLGASWRRLTDLFAGSTQADGMALLEEAERVLGLPPGAVDAEEVVNGAEQLADALGWLGDFDDDAQRVGCGDGGW